MTRTYFNDRATIVGLTKQFHGRIAVICVIADLAVNCDPGSRAGLTLVDQSLVAGRLLERSSAVVYAGAEGVHDADLGLESGKTSDPEDLTSPGLHWVVGVSVDHPWLSLRLVLRDVGRLQRFWRTGSDFHRLSEYCRWH